MSLRLVRTKESIYSGQFGLLLSGKNKSFQAIQLEKNDTKYKRDLKPLKGKGININTYI